MYGKAVVFLVSIATVSARTTNVLQETEMPPSCIGMSYCFEKSENYPQERIDSIINEMDPPEIKGEDGIAIGNRDNDRPNHGCEKIEALKPIFEILDNNGIVRYVAQSVRLEQKIRTESCLNPGPVTHSSFTSHEPFFERTVLDSYNITCVEKRIEFSFLALSLDGNILEDVDVQGGIPVCCSCHISLL